jgi:putative flippase GtrA
VTAPTTPAGKARPSLFARVRSSIDVLYREMVKFGAVGAVAFVVDIGVFNLMRTGIIGGDHGLPEKPLTAKTISVLVATVVAWLGNRYWTFRHRRRASRRREFTLFLVMNLGGLGISLVCLAFSHYVLGLTSALSDNIAGNVIGLGFGTLFRFWAYRQLVFTTPDEVAFLNDEPAPRPGAPVAVADEPTAPADEPAAGADGPVPGADRPTGGADEPAAGPGATCPPAGAGEQHLIDLREHARPVHRQRAVASTSPQRRQA